MQGSCQHQCTGSAGKEGAVGAGPPPPRPAELPPPLTPKRWPRVREKPTGSAAEPGRPSWRSSKLAKTQRMN